MRSIGASSRRLSRIMCVLAIYCVDVWAQIPKPSSVIESSRASTATTPRTTPELTATDVEAFLDGLVPMQLQREDIAGAVIVVVKNGSILFSKGYGYADVKKRMPVSPTGTLFRPGSISKTF